MSKFLASIAMVFLLLFATSAEAGLPAGDGVILEKIKTRIETDSRWGSASVEVSNLDLSSLARHGKMDAVKGFDSLDVEFLGQVRPGKRFTMRVVFFDKGKVLTDLLATARITAFKEVVVAMRSLRIRDKVGAGDVRIERMQLRELDIPVFEATSDVIGQRVRRPIRAGAYIKKGYVHPETLVRRGDKIIVVAENGVLKVRSKAHALEDGYPGSVVEARTVGGKIVFGTVNSRGELSVAF